MKVSVEWGRETKFVYMHKRVGLLGHRYQENGNWKEKAPQQDIVDMNEL